MATALIQVKDEIYIAVADGYMARVYCDTIHKSSLVGGMSDYNFGALNESELCDQLEIWLERNGLWRRE